MKATNNPASGHFAVQIRKLDKIYAASRKNPAHHALKKIDLNIARGSIFGLLGPNGAGKSTLINILSGMSVKSSGTAEILGFNIDASRKQASSVLGVVPQEIVIDPFFTPRESLELVAGFFGIPKKLRRTEELLDMVGLADKADAYSRQLSGGMKRRLMVAKAMVHSPPVLILDEPTAGVDVELRRQLWSTIETLHDKGVTIILTTHYLMEAQQLCDTIAIINHGKLITCEPTETLLQRLDYKILQVIPRQPLTAIPTILLDHNQQVSLTLEGGLSISYRSSETSMETLLSLLKRSDIDILDLATEEPDLEDVFVALTSN